MKIRIRGGEVVDFLIDVKDGVAYVESSGVIYSKTTVSIPIVCIGGRGSGAGPMERLKSMHPPNIFDTPRPRYTSPAPHNPIRHHSVA